MAGQIIQALDSGRMPAAHLLPPLLAPAATLPAALAPFQAVILIGAPHAQHPPQLLKEVTVVCRQATAALRMVVGQVAGKRDTGLAGMPQLESSSPPCRQPCPHVLAWQAGSQPAGLPPATHRCPLPHPHPENCLRRRPLGQCPRAGTAGGGSANQGGGQGIRGGASEGAHAPLAPAITSALQAALGDTIGSWHSCSPWLGSAWPSSPGCSLPPHLKEALILGLVIQAQPLQLIVHLQQERKGERQRKDRGKRKKAEQVARGRGPASERQATNARYGTAPPAKS
jgi:hypothetical protein